MKIPPGLRGRTVVQATPAPGRISGEADASSDEPPVELARDASGRPVLLIIANASGFRPAGVHGLMRYCQYGKMRLYDTYHITNPAMRHAQALLPAPSLRGRSASLRTFPDGAGWRRPKRLISRSLLAVRPSISNFSPCSQGSALSSFRTYLARLSVRYGGRTQAIHVKRGSWPDGRITAAARRASKSCSTTK
jgi:hypothetical protein